MASKLSWGATHVLAVERKGVMCEVLVRKEGRSLFTADEWAGHALPEWTLERGKVCHCGQEERGRSALRPLVFLPLGLGEVLSLVEQGVRDAEALARRLGRARAEVDRALATLERLGKLPALR